VPVQQALAGYPAFQAGDDVLGRLRRGQQAPLAQLAAPERTGQTALVLDPAGNLAAIIEAAGARPAWRLVRLLGDARS
jgi:hypothetical protein